MQQNCYVFKEEKMHSPPVFFFCHLLDYLRMDGGGIFVHMCDNNVDFVCGTQRNLFAAGTHICLVGVTFTPLAFSNSVSTHPYSHLLNKNDMRAWPSKNGQEMLQNAIRQHLRHACSHGCLAV